MSAESRALRFRITGVVQGVGFRPFVYGLAMRHTLAGWVCNTSAGVEIEVEGPSDALDRFVHALKAEAPPLAKIDGLSFDPIDLNGYTQFVIRDSVAQEGAFQPISPDICVCDDCLRELMDPVDRRFRYPFINCTNCGPRFTIIQDIPYDRPQTTMSAFPMCIDCQTEYDDPLDRRFHAQPNACPVCGPQVRLQSMQIDHTTARSALVGDEAIRRARILLADGKIVAVKGLGGFHIACDATSSLAVTRLREKKGRVDKPFALMAFDLATIRTFCHVDDNEEVLLASPERPIVILRERSASPVSALVAPGINDLGVMLPYTPLHYLLLEPGYGPIALVMTSGNYSEEPIATENEEALHRFSHLVDAVLLHDRDIHARCDDSVTRVFRGAELPLRRSRGFAPYPIYLPFGARQVLAVGGGLKNVFCATKDRYAFLSQHIGDLENYETLRSFETAVEQLKHAFRVSPEIIAHDAHPAYLSTAYAKREARDHRIIAVQHHHAHVAACMAENGLDGSQPVIGVTFDGTGYGTDGAIWGGEFLVSDYVGFRRAAHLSYVPLPGGDLAIRKPYRTALAHMWSAGVAWDDVYSPVMAAAGVELGVILRQIEREFNAVPTSSMGRLFDAVASLSGVRQTVTYEAQAAIELEVLQDSSEHGAYDWELITTGDVIQIGAGSVIRAVADDVRSGRPLSTIAARFHNGVAMMVLEVCLILRGQTDLSHVALSGGVWQNTALLAKTLDLLEGNGFSVLTHRLVPPNDGGLSLGQAAVANFRAGDRRSDLGP